jgi:HEAT repeat protein
VRARIAAAAFVAVAVAAGIAWLVGHAPERETTPPEPTVSLEPAPAQAPVATTAALPLPARPDPPVAPAAPPADAAERESRIAALDALAREEDPESLRTILASLSDPDPAIRRAALEATLAFGSREAIPRLQDVAATTEDPVERGALLDAAAYLELPTLGEYREKQRTKRR